MQKLFMINLFYSGKFFLPDVFPQLAIKRVLKMPNNILICDNNSGRLDIYLPKTPGLVVPKKCMCLICWVRRYLYTTYNMDLFYFTYQSNCFHCRLNQILHPMLIPFTAASIVGLFLFMIARRLVLFKMFKIKFFWQLMTRFMNIENASVT